MEDQLLLLNEVWKMEDQLLHCNSIITGSPRGSQIFFQCKCVKISADDRGIYNASCENHTPCVFPSQVWHQLIFPEAVSTDYSIYSVYLIGDHVYLKDNWATFVEKRDNDG